jgi:hypothetical protein
MRVEQVEILSDAPNRAVLRHPGRHFPGLLVQGDTLFSLCANADLLCQKLERSSLAFGDANALRNTLQDWLAQYKAVLTENGMSLPFSEIPL